MEKLINKDFFSTINEGCLDNQMIRFIISDNNFLIPDLYNNFKGEEFFVKSTKEELKIFSENINEKYTKLFNKNNIVEVIENIILKHIIGIIGLARKAKKVVIGFDEIKIQLKKNKIFLLLQAENFSKKREKQINLPVYQLENISNGMFKVFCEVRELNLFSEADGRNKKDAEQKAAAILLEKIINSDE